MRLLRVSLLIFSSLMLTSCGDKENWTLFVYPAGSSGHALITPGFTREMCKLAGQEAVQSHSYAPGRSAMIESGNSGQPTFECGRQCRVDEGRTISVCAETIDADD
ncbi:MAG: hypothetical protein Q7J26_08805 [Brevundimonas sp.]|uniref:hypothetical protein n=1 Tax=Brevundimonas sp. TaxID=1871086 RepID=UPI00271690FF|nr:hypothetical protein [Brevundimonas sp.]MDO9608609.1 hypothetical protein [Brevundimonas sp.]